MIYDRADWHFNGDYPADLPPQNGGTHIGVYFAWLVNNHLESSFACEKHGEALDAIRQRHMSGRQYLANYRDGEMAELDINQLGNAFTRAYYNDDTYFEDYAEVLVGGQSSLYHVDDSWENYDAMAARIDERFQAWKKQQRPWWRFW